MKKLSNYKSVFIELKRDSSTNCLIANWIGMLGFEEVKTGALAVIEEIKDSGYQSLINDNRQVIGDWRVANDWIMNDWLPLALENNLQKFAHILSPYYYGKLSAEDLQSRIGGQLEMKIFQNEEEAKKWIRE